MPISNFVNPRMYQLGVQDRLATEQAQRNNMLAQQRVQAFNRYVQQLPKDQQLQAQVYGPENLPQFQANQAASEQARRQRAAEYGTATAERFARWQQQNPEADPNEFLQPQYQYGAQQGILTQPYEQFAQGVSSLAMGSQEQNQVNSQLRNAFNEETGREEIFMFNPRTREFETTGVAAPRSRNDVAEALSALAPILSGQQVQGLASDSVEAGLAEIDSTENVLQYVDMLYESMDEAGGSTQGVLGWIRNTGTGFRDQLNDLREFGGAGAQLANLAENVTREAQQQEDLNADEFFNSELGAVDYLFNALAYTVAKMRDPNGRISDADLRNSIRSLGGGPSGSDAKLMSALSAVEREALTRYDRARRDVGIWSGRTGQDPLQIPEEPSRYRREQSRQEIQGRLEEDPETGEFRWIPGGG